MYNEIMYNFKYRSNRKLKVVKDTNFIKVKNHIFNKKEKLSLHILEILCFDISIVNNLPSQTAKIRFAKSRHAISHPRSNSNTLLKTFGRQCTSAHQCSQDRAHVTVSTQVSARPCVTIVKPRVCRGETRLQRIGACCLSAWPLTVPRN